MRMDSLEHIVQVFQAAGQELTLYSYIRNPRPDPNKKYERHPTAPTLCSYLSPDDLSDDYLVQGTCAELLSRDGSELGVGTMLGTTKDPEHILGIGHGPFLPCFDSGPAMTAEWVDRKLALGSGWKFFDTGAGFHCIGGALEEADKALEWSASLAKLADQGIVDAMWLDYWDKDSDAILRVSAGPGRPFIRAVDRAALRRKLEP